MILTLFRLICRLWLRRKIYFARLKWWFKLNVLQQPKPKFNKVMQFPAILALKEIDFLNFCCWCVEMGSKHIGLFDPEKSTLNQNFNSFLSKLKEELDAKVLIPLQEEDGKISLYSEKYKQEFELRILKGEEDYVKALQDRLVSEDLQTNTLPSILNTMPVDMLLLCGTEFLNGFPPLSLRACEIYTCNSPLSIVEFYTVYERFARSVQRFGT